MRKVLYLFGQLDDSDLDWLVAVGTKQPAATDTVLIREGQPVGALYLLLDGVLEVTGTGISTPIRLMAGEVVGEISFIDSRPPTATVTAKAGSTVLMIPRDKLSAKLKRDSDFASHFYYALAVFLAQRLRDTVRRLGYGASGSKETPQEVEGELSIEALDHLAIAGARFDRVLQRLLGRE